MNGIVRIKFALKQLWREWKAGQLNILIIALLIAISSHTTIGFFTDRIEKAMELKSRDMLGGDLVITSPDPIFSKWLSEAENLALKIAETQQFSSVIINNEELLLVSVKSVSDTYPLKGALKVTDTLYGPEQEVKHGPQAGEIWLEARVMNKLQLELGHQLDLGSAKFIVSKIITQEPDGGNFYSFTPRVMINQNDLLKTEIVQPGSRVSYQYLFAGPQESIDQFKLWLTTRLTPRQELVDLQSERPAISNALDKAQQYMGLASLLAVLLAAVAIAISAKHYSERHFDTSALLRCLGCQQKDILIIYFTQLTVLAILAGFIGALIGWFAQTLLIFFLGDLLPEAMPLPDASPFVSGMAISFLVLHGFALPSLIRLGSMSPLRVLRKDVQPVSLSAWLVYGGSLLMVIIMMWFYTGSIRLTMGVLLGTGFVFLLASALIALLFWLLEKISHRFSMPVRAGMRNLLRRREHALGQTIAFGLTLMAMLVVLSIRTELLSNWQNTLPDDAPNYFAINILKKNKAEFENFLDQENITTNKLYPMVRGRLTRINGTSVKEAVSKEEKDHESLNRELNLTAIAELAEDNKIIAGTWWSDVPEKSTGFGNVVPGVSIESRLAEKLGIKLGDKLTFFTGYKEWVAEVKSIRQVKWESFQPNFYLIFEPYALNGLPYTYMTSFYLPEDKRHHLNTMVKKFPELSVFELNALLKQVKSILSQLTLAVEFVLVFVLAAGFCIALATLKASMSNRLLEGALNRTLGASRKIIQKSQRIEFATMGFISGIIAVAGAEIVNGFSYIYIFHMNYQPVLWAWLLLPVLSACFIGLIGPYSSRQILNKSPMLVLRDI